MALVRNDREQPLWSTVHRKILPLILLVTMCAAVIAFSSADYLPGSGPRFVNGKVAHWERDLKSDYLADAKIALTVGGLALTADFRQAFVRFDRNRNRRLWPVVAADLTRSPPASSVF